MATRTIANGGGNWNVAGTWVENAVPTSSDDVVATATSGNLVVNAVAACRSLDLTNYVGTLSGSSNMTVGAGTLPPSNVAMKIPSSMTYSWTGSLAIQNTNATTCTVDMGGKTHGGTCTWSGNNTLASAFACATTLSHTIRTFDTAGYSVTCGTFGSTGSSTRSLTLGSTTITATTGAVTAVSFTGSALTLSAGSSTIRMTGSNVLFSSTHSGLTFGTIEMAPAAASTGSAMSGSFTCANLTLTGSANNNDRFYTPEGGTITVTGTLTATGAADGQRIWLAPGQRALTIPTTGSSTTIALGASGVVSLSNVDFMDIAVTGTAAPVSGTRVGDCLGNSGITFTSARTLYWVGGSGNWNDSAKWTTTSGGSSGSACPLPQDSVIFDDATITTGSTGTINIDRCCADITNNCVSKTISLTATGTVNANIFGSFNFGTRSLPNCTLRGRGSHTLAANASGSSNSIVLNAPGGTYTLGSNVGINGALSLTAGKIALSSFILKVDSNSTLQLGTATREVDFGTGQWYQSFGALTLSASGTGLTISGASTGTLRGSTSTGTNITSAGWTMPSLLMSAASGTPSTSFVDAYSTPGTITVTGGIVSTNNQTVTCAGLISSGSTARTLSLGSSNITVNGQVSLTGTNLTLTAGTSTITVTPTTSVPFATDSALTFATVVLTPGNGNRITMGPAAPTFGTLTINGSAAGTGAVTLPASATVTGTLTIAGADASNHAQIWEPMWGGVASISAATTTLSNVDFYNIAGTGAGSWTGTNVSFTYTGWKQAVMIS